MSLSPFLTDSQQPYAINGLMLTCRMTTIAGTGIQLPLYLTSANPASNVVVIKDVDGRDVFAGDTSNLTFHITDTGGAVYQWEDSRGQILCMHVVNGIAPLHPQPAIVHPAAITPITHGVTSVKFKDNWETPHLDVTFSNQQPVEILAGRNMTIDSAITSDLTGESKPGIVLHADGGKQIVGDDCEPTYVIRTINHVGTTHGPMHLTTDKCLRYSPEIEISEDGLGTVLIHGMLGLADDCRPCCDCEHYERVAAGMNRVHQASLSQAERISVYGQEYRDMHDAIQPVLERVQQPVALRVSSHNDCDLAISARYFNFAETPTVGPVRLTLTFEHRESDEDEWETIQPAETPRLFLLTRQHLRDEYATTLFSGGDIVIPLGTVPSLTTHVGSLVVRVDAKQHLRVTAVADIFSDPDNSGVTASAETLHYCGEATIDPESGV